MQQRKKSKQAERNQWNRRRMCSGMSRRSAKPMQFESRHFEPVKLPTHFREEELGEVPKNVPSRFEP
ncbi:hypothetical protein NECAME_12748 [Necator americanus]|uniref:Uncharacterized protein n=1 Tax=Necator americanus TaxID=51031 RepID=W2T1C6_NECAM|nr:hypothetical protein NECAME_12748 [Necator americanus]ETN74762.1 hypothetical protein NECAME_12748 [Necator americanus]